MNYEKAYKEALERAKESLKDGTISSNTISYIEEIFPELKESEDEKIRNFLIKQANSVLESITDDDEEVPAWKSALAWLEKQGEQKPADKVEPKFKVGDKIQYLKGCGTIMTIEKIENDEYIFANNIGHTTIEDGNKWYLVECNPTWSEKDEIGLCDALWCIKQASRIAKDENEMGNCWYAENWLKSLKERMQPHPKQEWSEEDESRITTICTYLQDYARLSGSESRTIRINEYCDWLKSLKDRCLPQQQHEWSEEDECNMRRIIRVLEDNDSDWDALTAWLKSLKPQNRWKPNIEQLEALWCATEKYIESDNEQVRKLIGEVLESLYNDLKKLTE